MEGTGSNGGHKRILPLPDSAITRAFGGTRGAPEMPAIFGDHNKSIRIGQACYFIALFATKSPLVELSGAIIIVVPPKFANKAGVHLDLKKMHTGSKTILSTYWTLTKQ